MEKMANIVNEAIAEAKQLKEMALINAKQALEETFKPHLKKLIENQIEELESDLYEDSDNLFEEEDLDLDEILKELEMGEDDALLESDSEEDDSEDEDDSEEGNTIDLENMTDEDLKEVIEDVVNEMVDNGELEMNVNTDLEDGDLDLDMDDEEFENIEIIDDESPINESKKYRGVSRFRKTRNLRENKTFRNLKSKRNPIILKESMRKINRSKINTRSNNVNKLEESLNNSYKTIRYLKEDLNKYDLVNSKLIHTLKLYKNYNLNDKQRNVVLEAIDKASTPKEVKLVYSSLTTTLSNLPKKLNIAERMIGGSSRSSLKSLAKPKKTMVLEEQKMIDRFQKLAGLLENE